MTATATIEALLADLSQDVGEAPAFDADELRSVIHNMLETAATFSERIEAFISGGGTDADRDAPDDPNAALPRPDGGRFA